MESGGTGFRFLRLQLPVRKKARDERRRGHDRSRKLQSPLGILFRHQLRVVGIERDDLPRARAVQRRGTGRRLLAHFLGIADQVAEHHAARGFVFQHRIGDAGFIEQA